MTETPGPYSSDVGETIARVAPSPSLPVSILAERLAALPDELAGLRRRRVQIGPDNATAIYLANETSPQPDFGMIVVLTVPPTPDADAMVAELQRTRWGDPADHTVTATDTGSETTPAFRQFWRTFPPGLFALPNQPVYFLLFYRAGSEYAFMIVAGNPTIRAALTAALGEVFASEPKTGTPTPR